MALIKIDDDVLGRLKKLAYLYQGIIPEGIHHYYDDILHGNNLEIYCNTYNLPREKLIKMAMVCKILVIYQEIIDLKTIIESETEMLTEKDAKEYQEIADELLKKSLALFDDFGSDEQVKEEAPDFGDNTNLIVYSNFIEESKERTENAHSGREEQTKKMLPV